MPTLYAVRCPGDPYEDRAAHYVADSAESAMDQYIEDYRRDQPGRYEILSARRVDLEALRREAAEHGDLGLHDLVTRLISGDEDEDELLVSVCEALNS